MEKSEKMRHLFDRRGFGDVKKNFFSRREKKRGNFFSPRTMMTHRDKKRIPILNWKRVNRPENLVSVRQSDPHTNRTQRISDTHLFFWGRERVTDTCVNFLKNRGV